MIIIPFSGSKRNAYKKVKEIAEQRYYDTVYEPFGGSCILSVNLYNDEVVRYSIANDYDHFFDLYPEYLDLKDKVVKLGYEAGLQRTNHDSKGSYLFTKDGKKVPVDTVMLSSENRKKLQNIIKENVDPKFWRYFSLGCNFTFFQVSTHEVIQLSDFVMFNRYLKTDKQRKYLEMLNQITVENLDYKDFLKKYEDRIAENSLLIVDPPYPNTVQDQYQGMFSDKDSTELINYLNSLPCDYIYFHSDSEDINRWFEGTNHDIQTLRGVSGDRHEYLIMVRKGLK